MNCYILVSALLLVDFGRISASWVPRLLSSLLVFPPVTRKKNVQFSIAIVLSKTQIVTCRITPVLLEKFQIFLQKNSQTSTTNCFDSVASVFQKTKIATCRITPVLLVRVKISNIFAKKILPISSNELFRVPRLLSSLLVFPPVTRVKNVQFSIAIVAYKN